MNKLHGLLLSLATLSFMTLMGAQVGAAGVSTEKPKVDQGFVYQPMDAEFWSEVQKGEADQNYIYLVSIGDQKARRAKADSLEQAEGRLAVAMGLIRLKLVYSGIEILRELVKTKTGTQVSFMALTEIERVIKSEPADVEALTGELILDEDTDSWPVHLVDFAAYINAEHNRSLGYQNWAENDYKRITPDSYWDFKVKYGLALKDVQEDRLDSAIERFSTLSANPNVPIDIRDASSHQYARLVFEKGDFAQAYKIFRNVSLNPRERGALLLERAWSKYYQRDYSKALGLLTALEAPIFEPARSGEAYILKMLIYKELCYYDAAFGVLTEFNQRFQQSVSVVRKRSDLRKDPRIVSLAVLRPDIRVLVDLLNQIKLEKTLWGQLSLNGYKSLKNIGPRVDFKMRELNQRLDALLLDQSRIAANQILDWLDQISFLDYQTRIDSLRVIKGSSEEYKPEEIPLMSFDKIYWVFHGEFWMDELENLKVMVESQCSGVPGKVGP